MKILVLKIKSIGINSKNFKYLYVFTKFYTNWRKTVIVALASLEAKLIALNKAKHILYTSYNLIKKKKNNFYILYS